MRKRGQERTEWRGDKRKGKRWAATGGGAMGQRGLERTESDVEAQEKRTERRSGSGRKGKLGAGDGRKGKWWAPAGGTRALKEADRAPGGGEPKGLQPQTPRPPARRDQVTVHQRQRRDTTPALTHHRASHKKPPPRT